MTAPDTIQRPSLKVGFAIFASRPISLVITLIVAVVLTVVSFLLLLFPIIAAYYYAVSQSKREEFFIDLPNVGRTLSLLFKGLRKYLLQSYLFALIALVPAVGLYALPLLPVYAQGQEGMQISVWLQIIWIAVFLFFGSVLLHGYPQLIASNRAVHAFTSTLRGIKENPLVVFVLGFLTLVPFTAFVFHLLMVFTYPILAGWGVSGIGVTAGPAHGLGEEGGAESEPMQEVTVGKVGIGLLVAAVMFGVIYGLAWVWGGVGFVVGLAISLVIALMFARLLTGKR